MTQIVFFDIDGTLASKGNYIPASTVEAIEKLKEKDIHLVLATGRPPLLIAEIAQKLDINSYISMNGQYILYEGEVLEANPLLIESVDQLIHFANEREDGLVLCTENELIINSRLSINPQSWYLKLLKKVAHIIPSRLELAIRSAAMKQKIKKADYVDKDIYMVNLKVNRKDELEYVQHFEEFHFTRANEQTMDVINHGVSKAKAVEKILTHLKIGAEDAVAFGDGLNDLEMIEFVGTGIAMQNGFDELKEAADIVTDSVTNDGILKGLQKIKLL